MMTFYVRNAVHNTHSVVTTTNRVTRTTSMLRCTLIAVLATLALPVLAQDAKSEAQGQQTSSQVAPPKPTEEKGPVGAVTFGYIYIDSEVMPGQAWNSHLHGFFGIPQYNVKPWFSLFADFTQTYNTAHTTHENVQSRLGGTLFTARSKQKISPFGFIDAGVVRDSKAGMITTSPLGLVSFCRFTADVRRAVFLIDTHDFGRPPSCQPTTSTQKDMQCHLSKTQSHAVSWSAH
jgi:hypothetical protein